MGENLDDHHKSILMPDPPPPLLLIAAIEDPAVIVKILAHLGLPTRAPPQTISCEPSSPASRFVTSDQQKKPHRRNDEALCLGDACIDDSFTLVPSSSCSQ